MIPAEEKRVSGPLTVDAYITVCLSGTYGSRDERLWSLYQRGKEAQWNAETDIDWSPEVSSDLVGPEENEGTVLRFVSAPGSPIPRALWPFPSNQPDLRPGGGGA